MSMAWPKPFHRVEASNLRPYSGGRGKKYIWAQGVGFRQLDVEQFRQGRLLQLRCGQTRTALLVRKFGLQAQGLDDLEDILNSPAPALDSTTPGGHQLSSAVPSTTVSDLDSDALADSGDAAALSPQGRSVATCSSRGPAHLPSRASTDATESNNTSEGHSSSRSQYLLDLRAKNKAATAVATVAGAAAGGAVAGPFGIAAGAKTGALMVAVGAAAAGAAQHYYLPVVSGKPVAASAGSQSHTDSESLRPEQLP